jgi:hypothetical protein
MSSNEMPELIDSYLDGDLTAEEIAKLKAWLEADDGHIAAFAEHVFVHQQLRETIVAENAAKALQTAEEHHAPAAPITFDESTTGAGGFWGSLPLTLLGLLAIVGMTGAIAFRLGQNAADPGREHAAKPMSAVDPAVRTAPVAKLVNVTNCRWDKTTPPADSKDGGLRPGQSLHLLEGVAEINSTLSGGGQGTFQLEGPLALTLAEDGMPNLNYGKLSAKFDYRDGPFTLVTPLGRIVVDDHASLGVKAAANEVELHVFRGKATFDVWPAGFDEAPAQLLTATQGTSLRATVSENGAISVHYNKASESRFVTPASLAASQLIISDQYVEAIRAAKPVGYWRFEEELDRQVRNEMSDQFHLRMGGDAVRLRAGQGTRSVEFGITAGPGYMMSDDVFDGVIDDDYTVELWAKPTCFHHGVMFSLIDWNPSKSPRGQHRVHLEICGPRPGDYPPLKTAVGYWDSHPGRICMMNRAAEIFSSSPYAVRKWQHLVAMREQGIMRLYADGRLMATQESTEKLGTGMRILMGQLYPPSRFVRDEVTARLFVGEIDEVALYDRSLSEEELGKHLHLLRPQQESTTGSNRDL